MELDDFFGQKDKKKKKSKNKQNPAKLMEKLLKGPELTTSNVEDATPQQPKSKPEEDEWEALDDEENDIELDIPGLGNLGSASNEESSTKKTSTETSADSEEKKVWGPKAPVDNVADSSEPENVKTEVEPPPLAPAVFVPSHLRKGVGMPSRLMPEPNTSSEAEFPTLDMAATTNASKSTAATSNESSSSSKSSGATPFKSDDGKWEFVGGSKRQPQLPFATSSTNDNSRVFAPSPTPGAYVPPSRRGQTASGGTPFGRSNFESRQPSSTFRSAATSSFSGAGGDSWVRGQTISSSECRTASSFNQSGQLSTTTRPYNSIRPSGMRSIRESEDKPRFELTQTNRFAGLGELPNME